MKKNLFPLVLLFLGITVNAQGYDNRILSKIEDAKQKIEATRYEDAWNIACELVSVKNLPVAERDSVYSLYAEAGNNYANELIFGDSPDATKALEICKMVYPFADEESKYLCKQLEASAWYSIGLDARTIDYDSVYVCAKKSADIFLEIGNKSYAAMLMQLMATAKYNTNDNSAALELYSQAEKLAMEERDTARVIDILDDWQGLLYELGDMKARSAVVGRLSSLKGVVFDIVDDIDNDISRGDQAVKRRDFKLAEQYYGRALEKTDEVEEEYIRLSKKCVANNQYSMLYYKQEDYDKALKYAKKMIELAEKLGEYKLHGYYFISNLYSLMKDEKNTLIYLDSMERNATNNQLLLQVYDARVACLMNLDRYDLAIPVAEKADSTIISLYGVGNFRRRSLLRFIGNAYLELKMFSKAVETYRECEKLSLDSYGEKSKYHLYDMFALLNALAYSGDFDAVAIKYVEYVNIIHDLLKEQMGSVVQTEREVYWEQYADRIRYMISFGIAGNITSDEYVRTACEASIFSKALLLESEVSVQDLVATKGTEKDKELLQKIKEDHSNLLVLEKDYETNSKQIAELKQSVERDEYSLCSNFKEYKDYVDFLNIRLDDILKEMPRNSVLIEYSDYIGKNKHKHAAFVTRKKDGKTHMLPVFGSAELDSLLDGAPISSIYKDYLCDSARMLLWDAISQYVDEGCTIYYVPSGRMHQISLESLTAPDGKLLGEHYNFVRLSSARELVKQKKHSKKPHKALLYGGLNYDTSLDTMVAVAKKYESYRMVAENRGDFRSGKQFGYLPETKVEVDSIEMLLRKQGIDVTAYTGVDGCEESFLTIGGTKPDVIHFATHGFYYAPDKAADISFVQGYDNAMMLSGLAMSGANLIQKNSDLAAGVYDGLLRGGDVAKMNLKDVDIVVLSACATGLGQVTPEGVFGLQRAFKLAGVNTIIMTMWNVDDKATREFMVKFYERLAANKWNKRKAFNEAKEYMRRKYSHSPFYWAGFVMID